MKQTRLLEIIREEIAGALNEIEKVKLIKLSKANTAELQKLLKAYTDKGFDARNKRYYERRIY
jgi:hypothetical protein